MPGHVLLAVLAAVAVQEPRAAEAGRVVRHAVAAVEGDSAATLEARWSRRLARDSSDRLAALGLAALAQLTYQDSVVERRYRALLPAPGQPGDGVAGYAALHLGRVTALRGQWLRADTLTSLAVAIGRQLADPVLTAEALTALGTVRHRVIGPPAALATLDSALAMAPRTEYRVRALAHCTRAQVYSFGGNPRSAAEAATGLHLADTARDFRTRATCRHVGAADLARIGELDSALVAYFDLVADYRIARDRAGLAVALQWRSHLYRTVGWMAKARRDAEEAIAEAQASGMRVAIPWAQSTLAWVALQLGDVAGAAPHARAAVAQFRAGGDRYGAIAARSLEGNIALITGDWETAGAAYREILAGAQALGWAESEINVRRAMMNLAMREGDLAAAEQHLAMAEARARAANMPGYVRSNVYFRGVLALRRGQLERAERIFRGRGVDRADAQPQWTWLDAVRLAESLALQGKLDATVATLDSASRALDDWRHTLRDRQLRLHALQLAEDGTDPDLGIATIVSRLAHYRYAPSAFNLVERIRARDLADRLTRAAATSADSGDRAVRSVTPVTLAELREALPDDSTVLLRYVTGVGGEPTTLLVASWRDYVTYLLPPEDSLAPLIARFSALVESGEDTRALGTQLGAALLGRALAPLAPAVRRLVIVPDGMLHRVPFDALVLADGRYVVEHYTVSYAPSATVLAALWTNRVAPAPATALVIADPKFAGETGAAPVGAEVFRDAIAGRASLPRLRGSAREARAVARFSEAPTVRRRAEASEAWIKQARLGSYGIVHFATHALVDEGSVTNTALALAPGGGEDGFMNAGELLGLKLSADLVVLSACRTAGGALVRGEGIQGLAAPLLAAGARSVAVTWWPIGDEASVPMIEGFYAALASGRPAGDALREAKLAALRRNAPAREWAAFTIIGDPMVKPPLQVPSGGPPAWLLVALGAAAALAIYGVAMRRRRTVEAG